MIGAPITPIPMNAIAHSAMTRPRMPADVTTWRIVLVSDVKDTEKKPTTAMATLAQARVGETATSAIAAPKPNAPVASAPIVAVRRPAITSPPTTAPAPMADMSSATAVATAEGDPAKVT